MGAAPRVATVLVLLAISAAAALAQTQGEAEKNIRAADAAWLKAYAAKDVDKAVASLDDEGAMLPPNAPMVTGKEALRKSIATAFAIPGYHLVWHIAKLDVAASGDLGITNGPYEFTYKDVSGKTVFDKGKSLTIWKKQPNGSWKVLYDMFSSDSPGVPNPPPA